MPTRLDDLLEGAQQALTLCAAHVVARPPDDRIATVFRDSALQEIAVVANGELSEFPSGRRPSGEEVFQAFQQERGRLIERQGLSPFPAERVPDQLRRPRAVLLTVLGYSLGGDVSHEESQRFIGDGYDGCLDETPPLDTWIGYDAGHQAIVSWVPAWAASLIDDAISVASLDWLAWGEFKDGELISRGLGRRWC